MSFFNGVISISNISTLLFVVFTVLLFGYAIGRITIKGISLGDAGVFIIALLFGALFFHVNETGALLFDWSSKPYDFNSGLSLIESLGLVLFVTSVGYIAGPKFFGNFKQTNDHCNEAILLRDRCAVANHLAHTDAGTSRKAACQDYYKAEQNVGFEVALKVAKELGTCNITNRGYEQN